MSVVPPSLDDALSVEALRRVDDACARFEGAWRRGHRPRLEDYLAGVEGSERVELLRELLRLELHYRLGEGRPVGAADYEARLPGGAALIRAVLAEGPTCPPVPPAADQGADPTPTTPPAWPPPGAGPAPARRRRRCPRSPATRSWGSWAGAAWAWCTGRGTWR
jgi:hypothetical protein